MCLSGEFKGIRSLCVEGSKIRSRSKSKRREGLVALALFELVADGINIYRGVGLFVSELFSGALEASAVERRLLVSGFRLCRIQDSTLDTVEAAILLLCLYGLGLKHRTNNIQLHTPNLTLNKREYSPRSRGEHGVKLGN